MMIKHADRLMAALSTFFIALDDYERTDDDASYQQMLRARAALRELYKEARLAE